MLVIKVSDFDVLHKIDVEYISEQLPDFPNTTIIYMCTMEGGEEDDWIDKSGMHTIVIRLPYNEVKESKDIRWLMLLRAKERLGLAS